jgi:hypothetical protein
MSITPDEQKQFDSIVSDFELEDTTVLEKMEKKDKNSEMIFIPLPHGVTGIRTMLDKALFFITLLLGLSGVIVTLTTHSLQTGTFLFGLCLLSITASFFVAPAKPDAPMPVTDTELE